MTDSTTLDVKGLGCPVPIIRANRAVKEMIPGDVLVVLATDPDAPRDFEIFCDTTGHNLLSCEKDDETFVIQLEII
jgi:tRNA 2-thiouridine synthesizing protein A